jgi:hypothetical protein
MQAVESRYPIHAQQHGLAVEYERLRNAASTINE